MGTSLLDGKRMLAVDDEPDILDVLREDLEKYGVALDTASSYEEGFQKMTSYTYDLVILDIMGVRGFDLLMFATSQNTPVVMLYSPCAESGITEKVHRAWGQGVCA